MSFRLVQKSVTLNDLDRRNGLMLRYFAELGSFQGPLRKSGYGDVVITQCLGKIAEINEFSASDEML